MLGWLERGLPDKIFTALRLIGLSETRYFNFMKFFVVLSLSFSRYVLYLPYALESFYIESLCAVAPVNVCAFKKILYRSLSYGTDGSKFIYAKSSSSYSELVT